MANTVFRAHKAVVALVVFAAQSATAASSYYSISGGGVELQIGDELPLPEISGGTGGPVFWTGTMFPPLLIPVNPNPAKALIQQTAGPDPKKMTVPPGAFRRPAPGPSVLGVALRNPRVFQVRTNIEFSAPAPAFGSAVLEAGGRTGPAIALFTGTPVTSKIRYTKTVAQFGGPSQIKVLAATPIRVWGRADGVMAPCKHPAFGGGDPGCIAALLAAYPGTLAAAGAAVGFTTMTPGKPPPMSPGVVFASVPNATGLVAQSAFAANTGLTNMATSVGFPWTTGMITVSAPAALVGAEKFIITGNDQRGKGGNPPGVGTISLVSGALSNRSFTGPNANRGWMRFTLPEPGALLGAAAALAMLGVCHGLAGRRRAKRSSRTN